MNGIDPLDKRLEAERLINAVMADINAQSIEHTINVDDLLTQVSNLSRRFFGEQNRYLREVEIIRPSAQSVAFLFARPPKDVWENARDRMLALCHDMLSEVYSFGFSGVHTTILQQYPVRDPSLNTASMPLTEAVLLFEDSDLP